MVPIRTSQSCSSIFLPTLTNISGNIIKVVGSNWTCILHSDGTIISDTTILPGQSYILYSTAPFTITTNAQYGFSHPSQNSDRVNSITKPISSNQDCNNLFKSGQLINFEGGGRLLVQGLDWGCNYIDSDKGFVPNYVIQPGEYYNVINNIHLSHHIEYL